MLETFPIVDKFGGKVRQIDTSIYQLLRGEVYTIDGKKVLAFGGASSIDKMYRTEGVDWWSAELPTYSEIENLYNNLDKVDNCVDIVITHTCPSSLLRYVSDNYAYYGEDSCNKLLEEIHNNVTYDKWFFGHFHKDITIGKDIVIYNKVVQL